jgi:hypothetical protein
MDKNYKMVNGALVDSEWEAPKAQRRKEKVKD